MSSFECLALCTPIHASILEQLCFSGIKQNVQKDLRQNLQSSFKEFLDLHEAHLLIAIVCKYTE